MSPDIVTGYQKFFWGGVVVGVAIGYVIAVLTLDQFYKHLMKIVINEIHNKYLKCLEIIKKKGI